MINYWKYRIKSELYKKREKFWIKLAWLLPHQLVMWSTIRVGAHATQGKFENQIVPELNFMDALKRWDDPQGGDKRVRVKTV